MKKWSTSWTPINVIAHHHTPTLEEPLAAYHLPDFSKQEAGYSENFTPFKVFTDYKPEPEVVFQGVTEADLEKAKKESYQQGFDAGKQQGMQEGAKEHVIKEQESKAATERLGVNLQKVADTFVEHINTQKDQTAALAYTIAKKVAGEALQENSQKTIEAMVDRCIGFILHEPEVTITVHPSVIDPLKQHLSTLHNVKEFEGSIKIEGKEDLAITDCQMEWQDGGANLSIAENWQKIEAALGDDIKIPKDEPKKTTEKPAETTAKAPSENPAEDAQKAKEEMDENPQPE